MGVPPIDETRKALIVAWGDWDTAPGSRDRVDNLEKAYLYHGSHLGLKGPLLRELAIAWRRAGFTRPQALAAIEAGIAAIRSRQS